MPIGAMVVAMTMYLSNRDIRPTGAEAGEFLDPVITPAGETEPEPELRTNEVDEKDIRTSEA